MNTKPPPPTDDPDGGDLPVVPGEVGDACAETTPCADGLLCIGETCVAPEGPCATDADCSGDTYCLTDPPGDGAPVCVAYGTDGRDTNPMCQGQVTIGLFQADVQCEWAGPSPGDPFPDHKNVLTTPMVADLPHDSGAASEIIIVSYNFNDGGAAAGAGSNALYYGVIRILNGQTCAVLENIHVPGHGVVASSPPAIGDLTGDGVPEIVTYRAQSDGSGLVAFTWNADMSHYERLWSATDTAYGGNQHWDGPSLHDLDDDGLPEVIASSEVFSGQTGARLNVGQSLAYYNVGYISVLGDVDRDGHVELVARAVHRWNRTTKLWELAYPGAGVGNHFAFADFGTPGATPAEFDATTFDGIAEIVATGNDTVTLATLSGQILLSVGGITGGGPPTVGDFDNDSRPEIATAGGTSYFLVDLDCAGPATADCAGNYVRWSQPSQDLSSRVTGSAIFDFEGDGQAEAVYADECFTRIYDGKNGKVLYSAFRTSCTWYENPVIADPDKDQNTEILVGSNDNCGLTCPDVDPIHPGIGCEAPTDCVSGVCDEGYCRCAGDLDCESGYVCRAALPGTPGTGMTCRAYHPPGVGVTGLRVLRDRLDRWASSRPMWNQHAYSVTNINDNATVPSTSQWAQNFVTPGLNNYRQNIQGDAAATDLPDITGRLDEEVCLQNGGNSLFAATVCNRGERTVGAALPGAFYEGSVAPENLLCVAQTSGPVPVGGCLEVSCSVAMVIDDEVVFVVNDDGAGGQTTVECLYDNNQQTATLDSCVIVD
jgi:hypothetical protein